MSIVLSNISYKINNKQIIDDICLEMKRNEILSILGPNGSGKSTLLKIIAGSVKPNVGSVLIDGVNINDIKISDRAAIRSVMSQSQNIVYDFSVRDIVEMGWIKSKINNSVNNFRQLFGEITKECDIDQLLDRKFNSLSGGEQRMVHFARTLLQSSSTDNSPHRYIFFDEPTANLDIKRELNILNVVKKRSEDGYGIFIVLHDLNIAYKFSDRVILLKNGKVESTGLPKDVFKNKILSKVYEIPVHFDEKIGKINYY